MSKRERPPRKYASIWGAIKRDKYVAIVCDRRSARTIRTGVITEKCRDAGLKILNEVGKPFLDIEVTDISGRPDSVQITFHLRLRHDLVEIRTGEG